jgi:hypothetical protein
MWDYFIAKALNPYWGDSFGHTDWEPPPLQTHVVITLPNVGTNPSPLNPHTCVIHEQTKDNLAYQELLFVWYRMDHSTDNSVTLFFGYRAE